MQFLVPLLLALAAAAQPSEPDRVVDVELTSFDYDPEIIRLRAGEPVVLRLSNPGSGGHNFSAPAFFASASRVAGPVRAGAVEVPSHRTVEIRLVPARGEYRLRCTHTFHSTLGMRGRIVVE